MIGCCMVAIRGEFAGTWALTYGLRWEYYSPFNERDGLLVLACSCASQTIQQTSAHRRNDHISGKIWTPDYGKA